MCGVQQCAPRVRPGISDTINIDTAMKQTIPLLLLVASVLAAGCGHTNNLAKYDVQGKKALFRVHAAGSASTYAHVESPAKKNTVVDIIAAIGSGIVSDQGRKKLERAVNGDSISHSVALGMKRAVTDYLSITAVDDISQNPDFIIESEVTSYTFVSGSWGLSMKVEATSRMIDRKTGGIIWDDSESHTIPLSQTVLAALGGKAASSGASVYNAIELLSLDEDDIRRVVDRASEEAGREIGETLREDIADMHEGK